MSVLDTLGRVKFTTHTTRPIKIYPNRTQLTAMRALATHGVLSSHILFQFSGNKNLKSYNTSLSRLFDGGYVWKPHGQVEGDYRYNQHVYDLTDKGKLFIENNDYPLNPNRPKGHFFHQFMTSTLSAFFELYARMGDHDYASPTDYLRGKNLTVQLESGTLRPDTVFALHTGKWTAYALEADRATEPSTTGGGERKTLENMLQKYDEFIGQKKYQELYERKAPMKLLYITVSKTKARKMLETAEKFGSPSWLVVGIASEFRAPFKPPKFFTHLYDYPLVRADGSLWYIGNRPD